MTKLIKNLCYKIKLKLFLRDYDKAFKNVTVRMILKDRETFAKFMNDMHIEMEEIKREKKNKNKRH